MRFQSQTQTMSKQSLIETNQVLRNTYLLLSMTLAFSAIVSYFTATAGLPAPNIIVTLAGMFGLSFLTQSLRNSSWGILAVFAFTGFMGYVLGPILNVYIHGFSNGAQLIYTALGATGIVFFTLSTYVLTTGKDFSFLGGFLVAGFTIAFLMILASLFFNMGMFIIIVDGLIALMASGSILYQTSAIIHGGERNYIMATISLYCSLFNLFVSLLRILSIFAGNRD